MRHGRRHSSPRAFAVACLCICSAGVQSQQLDLTSAQRDWLAAHPQIRLAPYSNYAPAQFVDDQGVHRGIAAEYVSRVESILGIKFINVYTATWQELLDKAKAREVDVIALAAETTPRTEYLQFTSRYLNLPAAIIARDSVDRHLGPDDLEGLRVGVARGYAVHDYLVEQYPDLLLDPVPDTRTGLRKLSFGMLDVFISDLAVASHYLDVEGIANLHVVGDTGFVYRMGFASRNDWPELNSILEKALAQITPEEREAIYHRWINLPHDETLFGRILLRILAGAAAIVAAATIAVVVWNRLLQRRVKLRTAQLREELSERRKAARALKESEERVRQIIATALDAVITMDEKGMITGWSAQAETAFGWSHEDAVGRSLAELIIPPQYREAHEKGLERFLKTGEGPVLNTRIEITALHKDGHELPVELAIAPIQRGRTYEFSAFIRDITDRKNAEAELERHRHQLEELVAERTAEVKTLRGLLPICSYCKRIREGEEYTKSVEAYLAEHHEARFSHGVCPECYEKYVRPQLERL